MMHKTLSANVLCIFQSEIRRVYDRPWCDFVDIDDDVKAEE